MRVSRTRAAIAAAAIALTVGLAACGKDSSDTTVVAAAETVAADAAATEAAAAETVAADAPSTEAAAAETEAMAADAPKDIVDTAVAAGSFNTLAKLLTDAGLVETLKGEGPFTVFAPTDDAFAAVPAETLTALAADKALLTKVLTYHVVPGKVMAADIKPGDVATVAGPTIKLSVVDGKVMVNDSTVTTADVVASNGVIHVIDKVMLPPT